MKKTLLAMTAIAMADGREYKFTVSAKGMDGSEAMTTIFVIDYNAEGIKPEFTQVVR
ncbi:MAG: hypothetical protein PUD83_00295 [Bacteroidales bacterium]|nr:hypothetical protein [Bacteroidales bacterium]